MFVCNECVEGLKLSPLGREVHAAMKSFGPCECCEENGTCGDVSCQIDAYWDDAPEIKEMLKRLGL